MSSPTFDPLHGLRFSADGRDLAPIQRSASPSEWAAAVIRAKLWQIRGQWRYSVSRGLPWDVIFAEIPDLRVIQELLRAELSSVITLDRLLITRDGSDIRVTFRGRPGSGVEGSFSLFDRPEPQAVDVMRVERVAGAIRVWFSQELDRWSVPEPESFEILNFSGGVQSVAIDGAQIILGTGDGTALDAHISLIYTPKLRRLRSVTRTLVEPFRSELIVGGYVLTDDDGFLLTDGDGHLLVELDA